MVVGQKYVKASGPSNAPFSLSKSHDRGTKRAWSPSWTSGKVPLRPFDMGHEMTSRYGEVKDYND